jgi:hypothetical protein
MPPWPEALRAAQADFLEGLSDRSLDSRQDRRAPLDSPFTPPPRGSLDERWSIYHGAYVSRLAEALEDGFPAVRRILGPGPFAALVERYVSASPPRSFDLGRAGDRLASYLADDPLTRELGFLPDLAALEWALAEAFVAADSERLTRADLTALGPADVADLPLVLAPGTTTVASAWPIHDLWTSRTLADDEVSIELAARPQTVLVWRRGLEAQCRPLDAPELTRFPSIVTGTSLGRLADAEGESTAAEVAEWFCALVDDELFVRPAHPVRASTD